MHHALRVRTGRLCIVIRDKAYRLDRSWSSSSDTKA